MMSSTIHSTVPDRVANLTVREFIELLRINEFDQSAWRVTVFSRRLSARVDGFELPSLRQSLNDMGY